MEKIGIMGGTFDPIHYGHLVAAQGALWAYDLDEVIFVPSGRPPHKEQHRVTSPWDRYLMTLLATVSNHRFTVSPVEVERPGPSFTVDTVRHFQQERGPECDLFFITGADAIMEIPSWRNTEGLLEMCHFIAASRPGYSEELFMAFVESRPENQKKRIHRLEVPALAISSSDLRRRVREGEPIKYLLPESVEGYIFKLGLYRNGKKRPE